MKNAWDKKPSLIAPTRSDGDKVPREAESFQNRETNRDVTHSFHRLKHSNRSQSTGKRIQRRDDKLRVQSTSDSTLRSLKNVPNLAAINPQNLSNNDQFPPLSTNSLANQRQISQVPPINANLISSGWNVPKHQTIASMQTSTATRATTTAGVSSETSVKKPFGSQINRIMDAHAIRNASSKNSKSEKTKQRHNIQTEHNQSHKQTKTRPRDDHPSARTIPIHSQQHVENMLHVPQGITSIVKGKQKVKRKKSLSTLKKAILKERLEQYRASCGIGTAESQNDNNATTEPSSPKHDLFLHVSSILCLKDFVAADEVQEDDEYEEIVADLEILAKKVGPIQKVVVPRYGELIGFAFVWFETVADALAAHACWKKMILGGSELSTVLIPKSLFEHVSLIQESNESSLLQLSRETLVSLESDAPDGVESDDIRLTDSSGLRQSAIVHLDNMLTEEDFEDDECLMESKRDIETLSKKYGKILNIDILMETELKGRVSITYENMEHAKTAAEQFNGMVIGGQTVIASLSSTNTQIPVPQLILKGVLTDDDFDDDDCLEETKSDLIMLLSKFGKVKTVDMELEGDRKGDVKVTFEEVSDVPATLKELNGRMFGGEKLTVSLSEDTTTDDSMAFMKNNHDSSSLKTNEPMITAGGKVIPAQYAEMKRVPKIPNKGEPRAYAKQMDTDQVVPLLFDMLGELMRLQLRAKETNNTKVKRRLVLGLREVCRGIKSRKVKMVILANNLDEYGALEEKLQEILDLSNENEVPVISVLNKRKIGKAVGKNIKVSVVGVENPEGAFESFKKLKKMCDK